MKNAIPILTAWCLVLLHSSALRTQVTLIPPVVSEFSMSPRDVINVSVFSAYGGERVRVKATVTDLASNTEVMAVLSGEVALVRGRNDSRAFQQGSKAQYGYGSVADYIRTQRKLPVGEFRICWALEGTGNEAPSALECTQLTSDTYALLALVLPSDKDTVESPFPLLNWMHSGEFIPGPGKHFRLTLVEQFPRQTSDQAVRENRPLLSITDLRKQTISYPQSAPDLEPGKWYCWIVEWLDNGKPVIASEAWSFTVRERRPIPESKFVKISRQNQGAIYHAVNNRVYFAFEDLYSSTSEDVQYSLRDRTGKPCGVNASRSGSADPALTVVGPSQFVLDLKPYQLSPGQYQLIIADSRGDKYQIYVEVE